MENDEKNWRRPKMEDEIRERVINEAHERIDRKMRRRLRRRDSYAGLIPGAVILAIGVIFLLDSLGYAHARQFLQFWPLILIFLGAAKIAHHDARIWGVALLLFGIFLQLNELGIGHFTWGQFWPLLFIAAGAMALWSAMQARNIMAGGPAGESADPQSSLDENAIFGGVVKRLNTREFRGGRLQALFGGIEIDMRDTDLAENEAVIYANATFGGIELRVPETLSVVVRGQGIFGGYSDSTRYVAPLDPGKPKKTLIVLGTALFGGVEIRN
jgi:predicted membrane protein